MRRTLVLLTATVGAVALLLAGSSAASAADSQVVYNAVPATLAPGYPSQPFQAQQTSEFGDYVYLAGTARVLNTITVTMSDYALYSDYTGDPRYSGNSTSWTHPITVNVYGSHLGANGAPDDLIATETSTITIPWRPAGSPSCPILYGQREWLASDGSCNAGYAFNATFDLSSLHALLPNDVIIGIAFNTQTYGSDPIGVSGPYNSLNVAVPPGDPVTVGTDANTDAVFWNTSTAHYYADGGAAGVGIFREDTNWTPYGTVAFEVTATPTGNVTCMGTLGATTIDGNLTVPAGATCTLNGTTVTHDVQVQKGGTLIDNGATIGHDLNAKNPIGIGIGHGGSVGHDIKIDGVTGYGPGSGGANYVCNTTVGHDLVVTNGQSGAGLLNIGALHCKGQNTVGHDLRVTNNANTVDVENNSVSHDLVVSKNTGGTTVSGNSAGHDATCEGNDPAATGSGNTAGHKLACPA